MILTAGEDQTLHPYESTFISSHLSKTKIQFSKNLSLLIIYINKRKILFVPANVTANFSGDVKLIDGDRLLEEILRIISEFRVGIRI